MIIDDDWSSITGNTEPRPKPKVESIELSFPTLDEAKPVNLQPRAPQPSKKKNKENKKEEAGLTEYLEEGELNDGDLLVALSSPTGEAVEDRNNRVVRTLRSAVPIRREFIQHKLSKRPDISHRPTPSEILRPQEVKECFVVAIRHQTLVLYIFLLLVTVFISRTYPFALAQGRINAQTKQRVTNLSPDIETILVYSMSRLVHFMGKESMDEEDVETVLRQASQRIRLDFLISNDSVTPVRDILDPLLNVGTIACPVSIDDHAKREIIANFLHRYFTPLSFYFVRVSGTRRDSARNKDALNYRQFNSHRDQDVQTARMKAKERQRDADKSNDIVDSMFNALSDIFTRVHGAHSALGRTRTIWNVSDVDVFFWEHPNTQSVIRRVRPLSGSRLSGTTISHQAFHLYLIKF
ncbi:hypothetical protein BLNAU_19841 [Blattamonas nauphoetae]|uniref:Uncharacterized protein n=1 Tax=Blattamonas nauphoetae TaxID=2049346 RepID=A0ABQ9X4M1_9EUKA|nr:hypothetical protein BLNAU_19841 [Blattamonas nauphoetae]